MAANIQYVRRYTIVTALTCEVTLNSLLLKTPYCRAAAVFSFISCSTERSANSAALQVEGRGGEGRGGEGMGRGERGGEGRVKHYKGCCSY